MKPTHTTGRLSALTEKFEWRWGTAIVAALVLAIFVSLVSWLRAAAEIDSSDLGVAMWAERGPTEARLKSITANVLNKKVLASVLLEKSTAWVIKDTATSSNDPPKIWEAFNEIGGALTSDAMQTGLVEFWADELLSQASLQAIRSKVREHLRKVVGSQPAGAIEETAYELAGEYVQALARAAPRWTTTFLPGAAVNALLRDQNVALELRPATADAIEKMLTRNGFDASATQHITNFAKVFAPLLIASLGTELTGLLG